MAVMPDTFLGRSHGIYYIYHHHVEPRVELNFPKEEPFPILLRNIDVVRLTKSNHKTCSSVASNLVRKGQKQVNEEKQQWTFEKPNLDSARKLRTIFFFAPEDMEFKETVKIA